MTKKVFRSIFVVAIAMMLACMTLFMGVLYNYYGDLQTAQLRTELSLTSDAVEKNGLEYLNALDGNNCRLTWVAQDGTVLYDSQGIAQQMENHAGRAEIAQAFRTGTGESARYSATLMEETRYYAERLSDGTVLRVSVSRMTVLALVLAMLQPICIILTIALALSGILASRLSKKIVKPLNAINLEQPLENDVYDELSPVLTRLEQQHRQIRYQQEELEERESEFLTVTRSMNEGLVLLNPKGTILSMNPAAAAFLGGDCTEKDFLSVERDHEINSMIEQALSCGKAELQLSRNGRAYQLNASRIAPDGTTSGAVILIFDITEKVFAERNRREFTANVSHELKTPLQTILGSAELIENGLVKPEDMAQFARSIRAEASRLVALIDDIIRLSQLDEKAALPTEQIDLPAFIEQQIALLMPAAQARHITLAVHAEPVCVAAPSQLIHEIVYNLCENAIKYNVEGGSVTVTVCAHEALAQIRVEDTGIGIPAEHLPRIFERFYRVDKSHSKQIGGTGLGLSIVKHAVQHLNGKIDVKSELGVGTSITVEIPQ